MSKYRILYKVERNGEITYEYSTVESDIEPKLNYGITLNVDPPINKTIVEVHLLDDNDEVLETKKNENNFEKLLLGYVDLTKNIYEQLTKCLDYNDDIDSLTRKLDCYYEIIDNELYLHNIYEGDKGEVYQYIISSEGNRGDKLYKCETENYNIIMAYYMDDWSNTTIFILNKNKEMK